MENVAKYNMFKAISTIATIGTPIVTLALSSDFFVHRSDTSISAAGVFAILIAALFAKDKLAENFKIPSPFVTCAITLVIVLMIESIITPIKIVCVATLISTGIDTLTFRRIYKSLELEFPPAFKKYEHFGFLWTTTDKLEALK